MPENALTALENAEIEYAKDEEGQRNQLKACTVSLKKKKTQLHQASKDTD